MNHLRPFFFFFLFVLWAGNLFGEEVTKHDAEKVAKNHFYLVSPDAVSPHNTIIAESFDITRNGEPVYYAFNFANGGFVIVSADDRYTPVMGYSREGFYSENNAPDNWLSLMNSYAEQILYIKRNHIENDEVILSKWNYLLTEDPATLTKTRGEVVSPLCPALWNQDNPYNYFCPEDSRGPGGKVYAGCVATAMSMIMYYWRWPLQGTGSYGYTPPPSYCNNTAYPYQFADFGNTEYAFDGMVNASDNELCEPIALLMHHCGVAVDMMYCHSASGAYSPSVPKAIKNYFKYTSSATYISKQNYSENEWITQLKDNLDQGYPTYYSGSSNEGGHAFVCDGYDDNDLFHYNFGWSGSQNGYYSVGSVGGFNRGQAAVINFIPDFGQGYPYYCSGTKLVPHSFGTIEDGSGPLNNYKTNTTAGWIINPREGGDSTELTITIESLRFDLADGDYIEIFDGEDDNAPSLGTFTNQKSIKVTTTGRTAFIKFVTAPSSPTADGFILKYTAKPIRRCNGQSTVLSELSGTFSDGSPEEDHYPNGSKCKWRIEPDVEAEEIIITFDYFETENEADYLEIYDRISSELIAKLSGRYTTEDLPVITVPSNKALLSFSANSSITGKGFSAHYKAKTTEVIENGEGIEKLTLFPNPTNSYLNISFTSNIIDQIDIAIYSLTGQKIYQEALSDFSGRYSNQIDLTSISKGIYILKISSSNGTVTRKVILQ